MEKSVKSGMSIDDVIQKAGEIGKYQYIQLLLLSSTLLIGSVPVLMMFFAAHNPPWKCVANTTCSRNGTFAPGDDFYTSRCGMPRSHWEYTTPNSYSIVTQFDLYCGREWIIHLLKSIIFVGWAFGSIALGSAGDRFGRKKVLIGCTIGMYLACLSMAFSKNVWIIVALQFICGVFQPGITVPAFVMASEIVGHRWRPLSGMSLWFTWTFAICLLGVEAYFIRKWKTLLLVCTLPYTFNFGFMYFIPESIRWLHLQGREDDAVKILQKIGRVNKKPIGDVKLAPHSNEVMNTKSTYLDIVRPTKVFITTTIQFFSWIACGLVYYGVTFASDNLGGSIHRDYILASLVELPALFTAIYVCQRFGRKRTTVYPMFVTAAVMVIVALVPEDSSVKALRVVFGMIGKFSISVSYDAIYTWSVELYPTTVRSQGMGAMQVAARIGSTAAPWIAKALRVYHVAIPFVVMGVVSLMSGIVLLWLPETRGKSTMETLDDLNSNNQTKEIGLLPFASDEEREDKNMKKEKELLQVSDAKGDSQALLTTVA